MAHSAVDEGMDFGITARRLRGAILFGGLLAAGMFVLFLVAGWQSGKIHTWEGVLRVFAWGLGIGAIVPIVVYLASVLRLRVAGDQIEQTLFGIWVLDRRSISDLAAITLNGRLFPVVLSFRGGGTMRLIGIHLRDRQALVMLLEKRVPGCRVEV